MALAEGQTLPPMGMDEYAKQLDADKNMEKLKAKEKWAEADDKKNVLTLAEHRKKFIVPWEWLPAKIKNHGWCLVKCWYYENLFWAENMALEKKYVGVRLQDGETKIRCRVKQKKFAVDHTDPGEVKETLDEWETDHLVTGTCLGACL